MNSSHYPSLELCKKLTDAGFPETEAIFIQKDMFSDDFRMIYDWDCSQYEDECYSKLRCPSVMEMLDVMPNQISDGFEKHYLIIWKNYAWYERTRDGEVLNLCEFYQWTPDALAYCVLWLQENNYISFSK